MFCTSCGCKVPDDASFCEHCGTRVQNEKLSGSSQQIPSRTTHDNANMGRLVLYLFLIVAILVLVFVIKLVHGLVTISDAAQVCIKFVDVAGTLPGECGWVVPVWLFAIVLLIVFGILFIVKVVRVANK